MNVSCPDCRSIFRVDPAKVPPTGVRARCSVCSGVISIPAPSGQCDARGRERASDDRRVGCSPTGASTSDAKSELGGARRFRDAASDAGRIAPAASSSTAEASAGSAGADARSDCDRHAAVSGGRYSPSLGHRQLRPRRGLLHRRDPRRLPRPRRRRSCRLLLPHERQLRVQPLRRPACPRPVATAAHVVR